MNVTEEKIGVNRILYHEKLHDTPDLMFFIQSRRFEWADFAVGM
jgi:hypothetical protein